MTTPPNPATASISLPPADTKMPTPSTPADTQITQGGFTIITRKLPILKAQPIEELNGRLGITVPEMIFGDNFARITHPSSGWGIEFNAEGALDRVDKTDKSMLKVAYSKEWQETRQSHSEEIKEVIKPFDWSYSTDYAGGPVTETVDERASEKTIPEFKPTETPIPLPLLARRDPILLFDEVPLYEDELADNGISFLTIKVRVMPARLLLLSRFFLRLDDVIFRIRDTRVYVEFGTGEVIKEYTAREEEYKTVKQKLRGMNMGDAQALSVMRDPNELCRLELVKVVEGKLEGLNVNK